MCRAESSHAEPGQTRFWKEDALRAGSPQNPPPVDWELNLLLPQLIAATEHAFSEASSIDVEASHAGSD